MTNIIVNHEWWGYNTDHHNCPINEERNKGILALESKINGVDVGKRRRLPLRREREKER